MVADPDDDVPYLHSDLVGRGGAEHRRDGHHVVELGDLDADSGVVPSVVLVEGLRFRRGEHRCIRIVQRLDESVQRVGPERGVGERALVELRDSLQGADEDLRLLLSGVWGLLRRHRERGEGGVALL